MADERIVIEIDATTGNVIKQFKKLEGKSDKAGKKVGKEFSDGFSSSTSNAIGSLKNKLLGLGALLGGAFAAKAAVNAAAEFGQIQTRLETLTGSAAAANLVFKDLKEFSAQTPFQLKDIANASSKLIAFGFSAGTVKDTIKEIGEVAAGSGANLGELSLIYGQVGAAGKLTGERLLQLQERAIPIGAAIAKSMGVAESSVKELVTAGKVTDIEFQKAFNSMTTSGGLFAGSLEKQSKTLAGIFSTLEDNVKLFSAELGDTFKPAIIDGAKTLITLFQQLGETIKQNAPVIESTLKSIADTLLVTPAKFWLNFFAGDAAGNLKQTTAEIARLEEQLSLVSADYEKQKDSAFSRFIGSDQESLQQMGDLMARLTELKTLRDDLTAAKPGGKNEIEEENVRAQLAAEAQIKNNSLKAAAEAKAQEDALAALGNAGLMKQELIEQQLEKELQLITNAQELGAIGEDAANQRRVVALNNANTQILALKKTTKVAESSIVKMTKNINKAMNNTLGQGVANGIEKMTQAILKGEASFGGFAKMVLELAADMAIQVGKIMVATGIAQQAVLLFPGAPTILAGAALIAAGTVAKSIFGGGGGGASASTSGGGIASGSVSGGDLGSEFDVTDQVDNDERVNPNTAVSVTIQGDVFDSDQTGLRIAEILQSAQLDQNIQVVGAA